MLIEYTRLFGTLETKFKLVKISVLTVFTVPFDDTSQDL